MRISHTAIVIALVAFAPGCAGPPGEGPAPAAGLAYQEPEPNPVTYTFGDTAAFVVQALGYGEVEIGTNWEGTAELTFRPGDPSFQVQVRYPRLRARFRDGAGQTVTADETHLEGRVQVTLTPRGEVTVVDTPSLSPELLDISGLEALVRPLFVRLPGRVVGRGDRWIDTVTTREEVEGTASRSTSVITSELLGDTVVGDRRLLRIRTEALTTIEVSGESGGVQVEQRLEGRVSGRLLWDDAAHLLVERWEEGELRGTLGMPAEGVVGMPVTATVRRRVSLRP